MKTIVLTRPMCLLREAATREERADRHAPTEKSVPKVEVGREKRTWKK